VPGAVAQGSDGGADLAGVAGDVDDGVEGFGGQVGEAVRGVAVQGDEAGAGGDLTGGAAGGAGDLVALGEGVGGDGAAQELGAAEDEEVHFLPEDGRWEEGDSSFCEQKEAKKLYPFGWGQEMALMMTWAWA
jgi:hypothetical protein